MRRISSATVFLSIVVLCCLAPTLRASAGFDPKEYTSPTGKTLLYRIHLPEDLTPTPMVPLIVFFHGAGERGADNEKQLKHGTSDLLNYAKETTAPVIILAPQCPAEQQWVDTPWGADSHNMPKEPSQSMALVIELMKVTMSQQPVDEQRVYVTGLSMGGFGTWDILQRLPQILAAAVPICGGGDTEMAERIKNVPVWAFHGGMDTAVKTKRSRDMIAAMRAAGGKPKYTEYDGVGHNAWTRTYQNKQVLEWLFRQRKSEPPK
ncbi:dienelactone hydrolase family protein [Planctomycetota bacterium]